MVAECRGSAYRLAISVIANAACLARGQLADGRHCLPDHSVAELQAANKKVCE